MVENFCRLLGEKKRKTGRKKNKGQIQKTSDILKLLTLALHQHSILPSPGETNFSSWSILPTSQKSISEFQGHILTILVSHPCVLSALLPEQNEGLNPPIPK